MITLYGFGKVTQQVIGATRDLRVQWALEELGLPYRVVGLDHPAGELTGRAHLQRNVFGQLPVIEDDGLVLAESGAIVLYLAEKAGAVPADRAHYAQLVRWCFAAVNSVEGPIQDLALHDLRDATDEVSMQRRGEIVEGANGKLRALETHLENRLFLLGDELTVADVLMATVLRMARKQELLLPYERCRRYVERCEARPAFERALAQYETRLGVEPGLAR